MKIQRIGKKGKRIRAILCLLLSFICVAVMDMSVRAEVSMADYPSVYLSPDGSAWTAVDELPYCENYHVSSYLQTGETFSFWTEDGEIIETGEASRKVTLGAGVSIKSVKKT